MEVAHEHNTACVGAARYNQATTQQKSNFDYLLLIINILDEYSN